MQRNSETTFWAFVIAIVLAAALSALAMFMSRPDNVTLEVFRIASALIDGALGFFAGRASMAPDTKQDPGA